MFGLEISAAGYRMDTFTMIRGCTQFNKILLTVGNVSVSEVQLLWVYNSKY